MEAEPRIAKQYKCGTNATTVALAKITWERGWRVEKRKEKSVFASFCEDREFVLGHSIARTISYCLLPDTFRRKASKNVFKVGSVKFANSLSPRPSIVKKVRTGSKSSLNRPVRLGHTGTVDYSVRFIDRRICKYSASQTQHEQFVVMSREATVVDSAAW